MIERDAETRFDDVLDFAKQRRVVVLHLDELSRVLDDQCRIRRERCDLALSFSRGSEGRRAHQQSCGTA